MQGRACGPPFPLPCRRKLSRLYITIGREIMEQRLADPGASRVLLLAFAVAAFHAAWSSVVPSHLTPALRVSTQIPLDRTRSPPDSVGFWYHMKAEPPTRTIRAARNAGLLRDIMLEAVSSFVFRVSGFRVGDSEL